MTAACLLAVVAVLADLTLGQEPARECVLERRVSIPADLARPVPEVPPLCEVLGGLRRGHIPVEGGTLYYEEEGEGVPLVLISGGPGCTHHYFHPHFSAAAACARVIYYDQRGTGQSLQDPSGESYTIRQAVADLEALREALNIERWVVLGHSYGGLLAQCYALEHPGRLLGLVLVCASPGLPNTPMLPTRQGEYLSPEERQAIRSVYANQNLTPEQQLFNKELAGDWKRQSFYRPTEEEAARLARYEWRPAPGFRQRILADISSIDLQGAFVGFEPPTLIIESRHDLTWNTDKPQIMQQAHPGATVVMFEHSPHSPFADEPTVFFETLRQFITAAAGRAPALPVDASGRMPWPPAILNEIARLPWTGAGEPALELFRRAQAAQLTQGEAWFGLGLRLYDGRHYQEALTAFRECVRVQPDSAEFAFAALAWQGMILDLTGEREQALVAYRQALAVPGASTITHSQYKLVLDRAWVEKRLAVPFQRD